MSEPASLPPNWRDRDWAAPENLQAALALGRDFVASERGGRRRVRGGRPVVEPSRRGDAADKPSTIVAQILTRAQQGVDQRRGVRQGGPDVAVDGRHGPDFERAARAYQRRWGGAAVRPGGFGDASFQAVISGLETAVGRGVATRPTGVSTRVDGRREPTPAEPDAGEEIARQLASIRAATDQDQAVPPTTGARLTAALDRMGEPHIDGVEAGLRSLVTGAKEPGTAAAHVLRAAPNDGVRSIMYDTMAAAAAGPEEGRELRLVDFHAGMARELGRADLPALPFNALRSMDFAVRATLPSDTSDENVLRGVARLRAATIAARPAGVEPDQASHPDTLTSDLAFVAPPATGRQPIDDAHRHLPAADRERLQGLVLSRIEGLPRNTAAERAAFADLVLRDRPSADSDWQIDSGELAARLQGLRGEATGYRAASGAADDALARLALARTRGPGNRELAPDAPGGDRSANLLSVLRHGEDGERAARAARLAMTDAEARRLGVPPLTAAERGNIAVALTFDAATRNRLGQVAWDGVVRHGEHATDPRREHALTIQQWSAAEEGSPLDAARAGALLREAPRRLGPDVQRLFFSAFDDRFRLAAATLGEADARSLMRPLVDAALDASSSSRAAWVSLSQRLIASAGETPAGAQLVGAVRERLSSFAMLGADNPKIAAQYLMALAANGTRSDDPEVATANAVLAAQLHLHMLQNMSGRQRDTYLARLADVWHERGATWLGDQPDVDDARVAVGRLREQREEAARQRAGLSADQWLYLGSPRESELSGDVLRGVRNALASRSSALRDLALRRFDGFSTARLSSIARLFAADRDRESLELVQHELERRTREERFFSLVAMG